MNNIKVMDVHTSEAGVYNTHAANNIANQDKIILAQVDKYLRPYFVIIFFLSGLLLLETYRWATQSPPLPGVFIGLFLIGLTYTLYQIHEYWDQLRFVYLGRNGEPETSLLIQHFQTKHKAKVFNNVKIGRDNIDYIFTNKTGVFIVKVIKWHAPMNADATVRYNDEELLLNEYRPNANPVILQKKIADWLARRLAIQSGHSVPVKAIIVLPGWFVQTPKEQTSVKVMNPRELQRYFRGNKTVFSQTEKALVDCQLERVVSCTH